MAAALKVLAALAALLSSDLVTAEALRLVGVDRRQVGLEDDEIEFLVTVNFVNDAEQPDEAPYVVATVPSDGRLVEGSATGPGARISLLAPPVADQNGMGREQIEVSLPDGARPAVPPNRGHEHGGVRIRWDLPGPMDPGVTGIVSFRIRVSRGAVSRRAEAAPESLPGTTVVPGGTAAPESAAGTTGRGENPGK